MRLIQHSISLQGEPTDLFSESSYQMISRSFRWPLDETSIRVMRPVLALARHKS